MGILDFFSGRLGGSVGNNMENDPEDVLKTKGNLKNAGYLDADDQELETPFITRKTDESIKAFQRDNSLKVDGILKPGGETERGLFEALTSLKADDVFGSSDNGGGSVGFGGNVSGTLVPRHPQKRHQGVLIFVPDPSEESEKIIDSKHVLSLKESDSTAAKKEEQEKPQDLLENKPVEYDATGRMMRENTPPLPKKKPFQIPPVPQRKPETIAPSQKGDELLDFIGNLESSDDYNVIYGNEKKPLTKMTVKEVFELQKRMTVDEGKKSSAVGRYQIKKSTLKEAIDNLGIDENALFDEKLQDQLARELLRKRGFEKYKAGKISTEAFIKELGSEWASLPKDASNKSRYEGVLNNRALTNFRTLKDLLEKE